MLLKHLTFSQPECSKIIPCKLLFLTLAFGSLHHFFVPIVTSVGDLRLWSSDATLTHTTVKTSNFTSVGELTNCLMLHLTMWYMRTVLLSQVGSTS